ncbi:MAG TPA: ACT domain-containing protein [Wenzhouxiangella sp.]|nr:ACT domain-containing protein [Wenzhouxiangella sp.]
MKHQLHVQLENSEGALLRVLGTVERRGFAITGCRSNANDSGHSDLYLTVSGARHPDILCRQLERLLDVKSASMIAAPASGPLPA